MSAITQIDYDGKIDKLRKIYNEKWEIKCDTLEEAKLVYLIIKAINQQDTTNLEFLKHLIDTNQLDVVLTKIKKRQHESELKNVLGVKESIKTGLTLKDKIKEAMVIAPIKIIIAIISGLSVAFLIWYFGLR